jgi:ADP-heptose:LPS heptosyltransferase
MPDCEFVNLQHGDVAAELAATPASIRTFPATDLSDFESLAGLAAELDLVISVQTALVHLCGAIGQTCLTFVPSQPEWRYGTTASTMPWYQSVRLYRQETPGDWDPVIVRVASAVRERLAAASGHPHGD